MIGHIDKQTEITIILNIFFKTNCFIGAETIVHWDLKVSSTLSSKNQWEFCQKPKLTTNA